MLVWVLMTAILVVVPDPLERWLGLELARVLGWAVACGVWVVAVESQWKARVRPAHPVRRAARALGGRGARRHVDQRATRGRGS